MNIKEFKKIFGDKVKSIGFENAFGGWLKESNECLIVLDLQKSNFGNYYELNIKVYLQGIFGKLYHRNKDLIKKDTGDIFRRQPDDYIDVFNFDNSLNESTRIEKLNKFLNDFIVPFTTKALSQKGLIELESKDDVYILPAVKSELNRLANYYLQELNSR